MKCSCLVRRNWTSGVYLCRKQDCMIPFLRQVAQHYVASHKEGRLQLKQLCFVFPNRRSIAFFRKWLSEEASASGIAPLVAPSMVTINDFFATASDVRVTDRINLLVILYDCYKALYPKAETLDEFIYWGDVLLGDFNDVDKYRVDPSQIFTNVADLKALQDDYSHLSENQRKAILSFLDHFKGGREAGKEGVKETFRQIWSILLPLYRNFNAALADQGRAYEGMVYRHLADRFDKEAACDVLAGSFPHTRQFVFVGLNALNECEKHVLGKMDAAGLAQFCWDWSGDMIKDPQNKSSLFMAENVTRFRPAFKPDAEGVSMPVFNVVSVPSSVGQVKQVGAIIGDGRPDDYAVVLPDESLLLPLLNSIPPQVSDINVTMGYPMASSEFYAFMHDILRMQMNVRKKDGQWSFYHKYLWNVFSSGIFRKLVGEDKNIFTRIDEIRKARKYYVPLADLEGFPEELFRPASEDDAVGDGQLIADLCDYLCGVVRYVGSKFRVSHDEEGEIPDEDRPKADFALEIDFAREYYTSLNRLRAMNLEIKPATFVHLLESMLMGISVPFTGEPLRGLQIMGPLETRALDFRNVVVLSANEGVFPRRSTSSSFIPPELRKGFGLPTYEYQDAVWAYYFYRMITRAENVWLLYDSRTEGLKSGEESRYIKQLRYHFHVPMNFYVAKSGIEVPDVVPMDIEKTEEDIREITSRSMSPSSVMSYIECPAKFYYQSVKHLKKEEEVSESMDAKMIGNVYHNVMRALLIGEDEMMKTGEFDKLKKNRTKGQDRVTMDYLKSWSHRKSDIRAKVMSLICAELHTDEVVGRDLVFANIIVRYVMETIEAEIDMLKGMGLDSYEVVGAELPLEHAIHGIRFYGIADRIDSFGKGTYRLVDYKTGRDDPSVLDVPDEVAEKVVEAIFDPSNPNHRAEKAGLQFFIYDRMMVEEFGVGLDKISNSMYATAKMFTEYPRTSEVGERFAELMYERLGEVLKSMVDPEVPFSRTEDADICKYCDFKMICGR